MGRPKHHDDEALYLMRRLIEDEGLSIRGAARRIAADRGYADHRVGTFEEWARKEYAARRDAGTLPSSKPLADSLTLGIKKLFQERRDSKESALRELEEAKREAETLDLDLSNPIHDCMLRRAAIVDLELELEADPRTAVAILVQEGKVSPSPTEDEVLAYFRRAEQRLEKLKREFKVLWKYANALQRVPEEAG